MHAVVKHTLLAFTYLAIGASAGLAQRPTQQQVDQAAADPALGAKIRAKIAASGLSPDQIRARLRAAGYSENSLDAFLGDSASGSAAAPSADVMRAVRYLGLIDSTTSIGGTSASAPLPQRDTTTARAQVAQAGDTAALPVFGLEVFRRSTSQFDPDVSGPVDANYKLGPRDVLALILTGGIENSYTLEVTREGFVVIPQVGQVYVANLTLDQARDVIFQHMRRVYSNIGRTPDAATHFYLTVAKLRTNQVFVIGEAMAPGSYQVSSAGTLLTALYAAGGPSDNGSLRSIQVRRGGQTVGTFDLYDYLIRGDASRDLRLETGDVVFIPVHGPRVAIQGEVIRPATYELAKGETLRDLLQMSGGFTARAGRRRVLIRRIVPAEQRDGGGPDRTVLDVSSSEFATGSGPALPLVDGDTVEVFGVPDKVSNEVAITGGVWTPGPQGFHPGMRLSEALARAGGVKPDVKDVLITRLESDRTRSQLRATFSDTLGHLVNDPVLQQDDSITVFETSDFRPDRYVAINGAVNKPGRYPWRDGMTLRDLVHLAGGLGDGAFLGRAEVGRLPTDRTDGTLARTIDVPLDSTYLLERGLDGKYVGPPGMPAPVAKAPNFTLVPYDNVLILHQPDWQLERTVVIAGEVSFPGSYTLSSKNERVSDLVKRAGGLLPHAYAEGASLTRSYDAMGRIAVDLYKALEHPGERQDITLRNGDSLFIPRYTPTVRIEGAVNSPITVAYVPGRNMSYYIDAAGGARYDADAKRAYVRQPTGIVDPYRSRPFFLPDHDPKPQAGAVVVVPTKDPNEKKDYTAIATSVAQILVSTVAIVAIVLRK